MSLPTSKIFLLHTDEPIDDLLREVPGTPHPRMVRLRLDELEVDIKGVPTSRYGRPGVLPVATQVYAE
jgi:hypothetical protein